MQPQLVNHLRYPKISKNILITKLQRFRQSAIGLYQMAVSLDPVHEQI